MRDVIGTLANIRLQLFNVGLEDQFPDIENPLKINVIPNLVGQVNETITSTAPASASGFVGQGNVGVPTTNVPYERLNTDQKISKANNLDNFIKP